MSINEYCVSKKTRDGCQFDPVWLSKDNKITSLPSSTLDYFLLLLFLSAYSRLIIECVRRMSGNTVNKSRRAHQFCIGSSGWCRSTSPHRAQEVRRRVLATC